MVGKFILARPKASSVLERRWAFVQLNRVPGGKIALLERSLEETVGWMRESFETDDVSQWQWGRLHTGKFAHFFAKKPLLGTSDPPQPPAARRPSLR